MRVASYDSQAVTRPLRVDLQRKRKDFVTRRDIDVHRFAASTLAHDVNFLPCSTPDATSRLSAEFHVNLALWFVEAFEVGARRLGLVGLTVFEIVEIGLVFRLEAFG